MAKTEDVSSIPQCVTIKAPLVRKATGDHLHFPRKNLRALFLVSATLEIEYAMRPNEGVEDETSQISLELFSNSSNSNEG